MVKIDMVDFAEKICGCKLTLWQKKFIRQYEEFRSEHPNAKLICGRNGRVYFIDEKGERKEHMKQCKYYTKHLDTIRSYIKCLYGLDDGACCTGGLLHIVTDDGNLEDHHIKWCLEECEKHPEREESGIGKLICEELLKLPMEQRKLVYTYEYMIDMYCGVYKDHKCIDCPICTEEET